MGYAKTSELGIETPEADNPPAITSDLKKLAVKVDELLRKQLTKLVELGKLKVTESLELPEGSIVGPALGTGTVRQETGTTRSFLSWGFINSTGSVEGGTGDFTVKKEGTGEYHVIWNKEKANAKYALVCGLSLELGSMKAYPESKYAFFETRGDGETPENMSFFFVALAAS